MRRVKKAEKAEKAEKATPTSQSKKEAIASTRGAALRNQLKYARLYMLVEIGAAKFEILKSFTTNLQCNFMYKLICVVSWPCSCR